MISPFANSPRRLAALQKGSSLPYPEPHEDMSEPSCSTTSTSKYDPSLSTEEYTKNYMEFTDNCPTTYHAVAHFSKELEKRGFVYASERESWDDLLVKSNKLYTTRNGSAIIAFVVGKDWTPGKGAAVIGTHIDSLAGKIKPISVKTAVDGYELLGTAAYSGALSKTWWDRDLSIGGRVVVRSPEDGTITSKLVRVPFPVAKIPTLAPHFGVADAQLINPETQTVPIVALSSEVDKKPATDDEKKSPLYGKHSLSLLRLLAKYGDVAVKDMIQMDIEMFDGQPAALVGFNQEFLSAPRIDDKICTYTAMFGLLEALDAVNSSSTLSIVGSFDNEEIGSLSRQGANSNFLDNVVSRLVTIYGGDNPIQDKALTYANSFFLSADVTHAVNPNYDNYYLEHHKPQLNVGLGVSFDPNGRMTTTAVSAALLEEVANQSGNKLQYFQIRNDSRSGGTIGPMLSARTGMRAAEIGVAQLSMHSIRATAGSKDVWLAIRYFKSFFELWDTVDAQLKIGGL